MMAPPVEVTDWSLTNWAGLEIELTSRYLMVKCSVPCASLPCSAHLFSTRQYAFTHNNEECVEGEECRRNETLC